MSRNDGIARVEISEPARNAAYRFNVGDVMLLFSMVAGTPVAAELVYGTHEFRPHNPMEAALQVAVSDWIVRARLIVMIVGHTSWVQWELREIVRVGHLGKLLLLLPPGDAADGSCG